MNEQHSLQSNFLMYQRTHFMCVCCKTLLFQLFFAQFHLFLSIRSSFGWLFVILLLNIYGIRTVPPVLFCSWISFTLCVVVVVVVVAVAVIFLLYNIYAWKTSWNSMTQYDKNWKAATAAAAAAAKSGIPLFSCWFSIVYTFMLDAQECAHNTHEHHWEESKKEQQQHNNNNTFCHNSSS